MRSVILKWQEKEKNEQTNHNDRRKVPLQEKFGKAVLIIMNSDIQTQGLA